MEKDVKTKNEQISQCLEIARTTDLNQKIWKYLQSRVSPLENWENKTAISDGKKKYTYKDLFFNCEKYASVFSALSMTEKNKARVGIIGTGCAETIFSFYALNMTGAEISIISSLSVLKYEKIQQVVKDEHLTDLIITDELIQENTLRKIINNKDELGLRFILLLHVSMGGCTVPAPLTASFEQKAAYTRACWGPLYMDNLVRIYGNQPIEYAENVSKETSVIIHTSGTTGGSGSPIVMSDKAVNAMSRTVAVEEGYDEFKLEPCCALMVDLSNAYGVIVQVHMPLCLGGKVVTVPGNGLNPLFFNVIPNDKISVLFCTGAVIDMWMKLPNIMPFDFSSIECVVLGGTSVSADDKKRFLAFFKKHGCKDIPIINGYGISELGGVCILSTKDVEDEAIGYLVNGMDARLFDEDTEEYKTMNDIPCTGVLYLNAETMSSCFLDGEKLVKTETIDGKEFVCTNDLVRVDESGKFTYLGRANRYFLHNNGIKFQSGLVETEIARQPGINSCGVVPVFDKPNHDNIPMLCVSVTQDNALETVRKAIVTVYIKDKILDIQNLPMQVLLAKELPRNANGKIDLYRINQGDVVGEKFVVETIKKDDEITDIKLTPLSEDPKDIVKQVYKGIAKDIMDESIPGQVVDNIKKTKSTIGSFENMNPMQYAQMLSSAWQLYSSIFNSYQNNMRTPWGFPCANNQWQNNQQFMQTMFWLYNMWQKFNKNKKNSGDEM